MKEKRISLNADKRKILAEQFEKFFENKPSKSKIVFEKNKSLFDATIDQVHKLAVKTVREHQPQEDIDTVKKMNSKYGRSGGDTSLDNCFNFVWTTEEINDRGLAQPIDKQLTVNFCLMGDAVNYSQGDFALAYFRDELKQKGFDPDYRIRWKNERRNPKYYEQETKIREYLGFNRANNNYQSDYNPYEDWKKKYSIDIIGQEHSCYQRRFKINEELYNTFNTFNTIQSKICQAHEQHLDYVQGKMSKVRLALQSYKYFDQAKELANELGMQLDNKIVEGDVYSTALSIYNPKTLANLLKDNDEIDNSKELLIKAFKQGKLKQAVVN